jgi:hypothetical protein
MKNFGRILFGTGLCLLLGPLTAGAIAFLVAPHFPQLMQVGAIGSTLALLTFGAVAYVPLGLILVVAGIIVIGRANLGARGRYSGRTMHYQLALQFQGATHPDYDAMIDLQRALSTELGSSAALAGHDMGAGKTTVFIHTADAHSTFEHCKPLLARLQAFAGVRAAYRLLDGDEYEVLWPLQPTAQTPA